jgi:hypothetical protein
MTERCDRCGAELPFDDGNRRHSICELLYAMLKAGR